MSLEIIPALLAHSEEELFERLKLCNAWGTILHMDVTDGRFTPSRTWADPTIIGLWPFTAPFELHLMVENPIHTLETWLAHVPRIDRVLIHAEGDRPLGALIGWVKDHAKLPVTLVLSPQTPTERIRSHLNGVDEVMCMGVYPGTSGQRFLGEGVLEKIAWIHRECPDITIGVDGGITLETLELCKAQGASRFRSASAIFATPDPFHTWQMWSQQTRRSLAPGVHF